jgi:hypothetical protein
MRCNNPSSPIPSTPIHPINITPCTNIQTQAASTAQPYAHAEFAQSRSTSNKLWRPRGPRPTDSKVQNTPPKGRSATPRALSPGASAHPSRAPNTLPSPPPFQQFLPPRSNKPLQFPCKSIKNDFQLVMQKSSGRGVWNTVMGNCGERKEKHVP